MRRPDGAVSPSVVNKSANASLVKKKQDQLILLFNCPTAATSRYFIAASYISATSSQLTR
jgi:hypothetical protein